MRTVCNQALERALAQKGTLNNKTHDYSATGTCDPPEPHSQGPRGGGGGGEGRCRGLHSLTDDLSVAFLVHVHTYIHIYIYRTYT